MTPWGAEGEDEAPIESEIIVLELYGGRDITDARTRNSKSGPSILDLYCTIKFGKKRFETPVIKNNMNPVWDCTYEFDISGTLSCAVIVINCYASATLGRDFIGEVRIPISDHQDVDFQYAVQHWFPLSNAKLKKKDGSPGELGLRIGRKPGSRKKEVFSKDLDNKSTEEIYEEANKVADEANESVHRSLRLLEQTREIGSNTVGKLRSQGEMIQKLQNDVDTVENNMVQSERRLRSIDSVWGTVANKVTSNGNARLKKKAAEDKKLLKKRLKEDKKLQAVREDQWEQRRSADIDNSSVRKEKMISRNPGTRVDSGSHEEQFYRTNQETDVTMDRMSDVLDDLKLMAMDMNNEINEQNVRLDSLKHDLDKLNPRINKAIRKAKDIIDG